MHKEIDIPQDELERLVEILTDIFIQRRDLYPRQMDDGSYLCIRKPLKTWHLTQHLQGELTLGTYVFDENSMARFVVFDADDEAEMERLVAMTRILRVHDVPGYLERSRRGGHLWLFLSQPVSGREARRFAKGLQIAYRLEGIEFFPKQSQLKSGPGSLVRLPFGVHRKTGQRYDFVTVDDEPLAPTQLEQILLLGNPQRVPQTVFAAYQNLSSQPEQKPVFQPTEVPEGTLSQRIKNSISVLDFVGQFVELAPNGRGLCPFHDDQHHSFSVNADNNYWNCFAGCGGGSIIDFWMKYQNCDFTAAVRELAGMLLK
jgi:hypothetical protein